MSRRVVLVHPTQGVYVGSSAGFGFWSMMDAVGQDCTCTFADEADARRYVRQWATGNDDDDYRYVELEVADGAYATIEELEAAGLHDLVGDLLFARANVPTMGNA